MSNIIEITSAEFEQKVLRSPIPVLLDFYAVTCGPCRLLAPILEELASELEGKVTVYKVDAMENTELANGLGISALPTVSVFKEGREVARLVGLQNRERLLEAVAYSTVKSNTSDCQGHLGTGESLARLTLETSVRRSMGTSIRWLRLLSWGHWFTYRLFGLLAVQFLEATLQFLVFGLLFWSHLILAGGQRSRQSPRLHVGHDSRSFDFVLHKRRGTGRGGRLFGRSSHIGQYVLFRHDFLPAS